jgi:Mor family transcriptional regulator
MMNRRSKSLQWRNKEIYAEYIAHLRNGLPSMLAYATIANKYDLSENHVRNIIMEEAKNH